MKQLFALVLSIILLTSCSQTKENTVDILNDFFSYTLIAKSSDEKFSFEIGDGKITVIYPQILNGAEIFFENGEIKTTLHGTTLKLPESSLLSAKSLLETINKIKASNVILEGNDGLIKIEQHTFKILENEIVFSTGGRSFTIKKKTENNI